MLIYVIGNPLVKYDSLPLKLIPFLKTSFPAAEIIEADVNENFLPKKNSVIIDTVVGVDNVTLFTTLTDFTGPRLVTPHDYDLGFHLRLLQKLKKINKFSIIGIPQGKPERVIKLELARIIKKLIAETRR